MARDEAYYEAEKKIQEARLSGATELDLGRMAISELPESLGQLTLLESLILRDNILKVLPVSIQNLVQIKFLNLSGNELIDSPDSLGRIRKLPNLQILNLSDNQLRIGPKWLGQLTQLISLNLSYDQLKILPESLGQLTQMQSLNLYGNQLTTLPESFTNLKLLSELQLSNNDLSEVPAQIRRLRSLSRLNLHENSIRLLPEWLEELKNLKTLTIDRNPIDNLPQAIGKLQNLEQLCLGYAGNGIQIKELPEWFQSITQLKSLQVSGCQLRRLPNWVKVLTNLQGMFLDNNQLTELPDSIGSIYKIKIINADNNRLTDLPVSLAQLEYLTTLNLKNNPLNPELAEAYKQGLPAVKAYLRAKAAGQITLNEAKLILVGEGEVGKTCLMDALLGRPWEEHDTTHGIEIKPIKVTDPDNQKEITLNGWDFGGQRVYRPTHQLFFSAPAVYLVVWKPREGPQQGFVKEWIKLVKHREPDAKILVVATHGGPGKRQPDIDRQELIDLFGKDTVLGFHHVESKPDEQGKRRGIEELKQAIARVAVTLPEVGRSVPKRWQETREALEQIHQPYVPLDEVMGLCKQRGMDDEEARLFITVSHRLGHLIHYEHDPALQDIVVLKPDWLATAIGFVLDDEQTRNNHGLVSFDHLHQLWGGTHA